MTNDATEISAIAGDTIISFRSVGLAANASTVAFNSLSTAVRASVNYSATLTWEPITPRVSDPLPVYTYARDPFIPPAGVGWRLSCPCRCEGVFLPGDDADRGSASPPRLRGIRVCLNTSGLYYYDAIWSNL